MLGRCVCVCVCVCVTNYTTITLLPTSPTSSAVCVFPSHGARRTMARVQHFCGGRPSRVCVRIEEESIEKRAQRTENREQATGDARHTPQSLTLL